jgi:DNA-binding response OmpR family regulator
MHLLVVEDQESVASFIMRGLSEEGYAVSLCSDGDAGLRLASSTSFDLIVMDLLLPGLSGIELTRALRERKISTPILMLTAMSTTSDKVNGLDAGADDYLTKPFAFDELLARIRALLRRGNEAEKELCCHDLKITLLSRKVTRGGKAIELTAREYALLEYLMSNQGRVLTRTVIMEKVWAAQQHMETNLVDVYIRHLRRKIDEDFDDKLLETRRGYGYSIRAPAK